VTEAISIWSKLNSSSRRKGIVDVAPKTCLRSEWAIFPMNPFSEVEENASKFPHKNHWPMTTALLVQTTQVKERADFLLERPV